MTTPSKTKQLLTVGVMTVAILTAVSLSTDAYAWGNRAGGGGAFAGREAGGGFAARQGDTAASAEDRKAAAQSKWKGKFKKPATATTDGGAQAGGQAAAGGWRAKMQARGSAQGAGEGAAASGGWRSRLQARNKPSGEGAAAPAAMAAPAAAAPQTTSGERSGTYTTDRGGSGTWEQNYSRGGGTSTRQNTVTNQNGQSAGWTTQQGIARDKDAGTVTTSTNVTGQNGKTFDSSTTYNPAEHSVTYQNTTPNGQSHGVTLQGDGTPGDGDRTGTYTTQKGQTGTYDQKVSYADGTVTRDNTVTNSNGQSAGWTTQVTGSSANGVTTKDKTVTTDNGKTENWDTTYNKQTGTLEHSYTGPGGHTYGGTLTVNQ